MKTRFKMTALALFATAATLADTVKIGDFTWKYTTSGVSATINGVSPATGAIEIPSQIMVGDNTYIVRAVGAFAFNNQKDITSVKIPDSVTHVKPYAFQNCRSLATVKMGTGVTRIDISTFNHCSGLKLFEVAGEHPVYTSVNGLLLSKDGKILVKGVNGNVTIPNTVTSIVDWAFSSCSKLMSINVSPGSATYASANGLLLTKDGKTLVIGVNGDVTIPDGVTDIAEWAFKDREGLTHVTIPDSLANIGSKAFSRCTNLTSVTIPAGVKSIGWGAFEDCVSLKRVTIPGSVANIEGGIFAGCHALKDVAVADNNANYTCVNGLLLSKDGRTLVAGVIESGGITIPDGVMSIGEGAFSSCGGLMRVTMPNSLRSIGNRAFSYCSSLKGVTIPDAVTTIGDEAFSGCRGLTSVIIPNSVTAIGDGAFSDCRGLMRVTMPNNLKSIGKRAFSHCSSLEGVTIPDSVTAIGDEAFSSCRELASVTIPKLVTRVGEFAFFDCVGLKYVTIGSSVTSLESFAFCNCSGLKHVTFMGNAPRLGREVFSVVPPDCTVQVNRNSTGWDVDIPGKWQGMIIRYVP